MNWTMAWLAVRWIGSGSPGEAGSRLKKAPGIEKALAALVQDETGGDPMNDQKWVRSSLRQLGQALRQHEYPVSRMTTRRLLKAQNYLDIVKFGKKPG